MSFIAAHTTRIGVGVSVLIMPYRNPVATAKSLATIDRMSGGRLIAGVGVGWNEPKLRRSACHSTSGGRAPTNICASGRPVGRRARSRSPAGSFRSPVCMSVPSRSSSRIPRFGLAVPAMRPCAGRRASPRCGSRSLCPLRSWSRFSLRRDARACRNPKRHCCARGKGAVNTWQYCGCTGPTSELSAGPIRNELDGADPLSAGNGRRAGFCASFAVSTAAATAGDAVTSRSGWSVSSASSASSSCSASRASFSEDRPNGDIGLPCRTRIGAIGEAA
jgi:hypothetical protein